MPHVRECLLCIFVLLFCGSCAAPSSPRNREAPAEKSISVYVIYSGFIHSSLAVRKADIPSGVWPASEDFPKAGFIEVGWGDEKCFREDLTSGNITKALWLSLRTVLRYDSSRRAPGNDQYDPDATIVEVRVSPQGFAKLCAFVAKYHARDARGRPVRLAENWYRARGIYCALHTCNNWVADALRAAGARMVPGFCQLPRPLMRQVKRIGRVVDVRREFPIMRR
jgi:hypothetical protein